MSYGNPIRVATSLKPCVGLSALTLVLLSVMGARAGEWAQQHEEFRTGVRTWVTECSEEAHRHLVSLVGTQAVETAVECVRVAVRFLSEGAAGGLNVIAAYVTEILRVTGVSVSLPFPHFTPEGVASVTQWALLALIGYWALSLALRLAACVLARVLWLLKLCAVAGLFAAIVSDTAAPTDTTAVRLAGLVLACALLGLVRTGRSPDHTARLRELEARLEEVERRKMEERRKTE
ncbi:hypothetical protein AAFF_G00303020 [Aldrovandia affinis]|uniref:Transmembrane protein 109 n=1 Tax=Aldrovandia affinis TaxID=143900 RepID=A0AAD7R8C8_9TELE|nr:hypothetical protein AAFF_G00303020 [Aldrovandia affinis]